MANGENESPSQPWWYFGLGRRAEELGETIGDQTLTNQSSQRVEEHGHLELDLHRKGNVKAVHFNSEAKDKIQKVDAVANMGFVDLVESLLLTHDASGPARSYTTNSFGTLDTVSDRDSDADSIIEDEQDNDFEWEVEEVEAFADQMHRRLCVQLEQEAIFMEASIKKNYVMMKQSLNLVNDYKELMREGDLAGLGLTLIDDDNENVRLKRIELSYLMSLTGRNRVHWIRSLEGNRLVASQALLSVHSPGKRQGSRAFSMISNLQSSSGNSQLRSPLFQMQRELQRLESTSSDNSLSESEADFDRMHNDDPSYSENNITNLEKEDEYSSKLMKLLNPSLRLNIPPNV